jgi:hypothetical protein
MNEEEKIKYLERVEKAAIELVKVLNGGLDYTVWDDAIDKLEATLKEKKP